MKRILLALTIIGFLLPLAPRAQADTEVSLNFFYDNLSPYGNWIEAGDYGYCFQPSVALDSSDWRPYSDGYWAYTDSGWTWVSYEDFGWATYHYGRWANLDSYGWVWVPGYEWGPAWVSWRTGGDYVGWAPLPPEPVGFVYEGRAITGGVDFTFGIGPLYYNFVDIRYIGEPVLRNRIYAPSRNVTIINNTVNVTNITYNNSRVYNYGPDYNRLNQYSTRPIQRLNLQRETAVGANLGQGGRRGNFNRVNGNQLVVVAPKIEKSKQPIAPKQVKTRVEKPKIEHGWQGVANRQQVEAEMKKASPKNVPPPNFQPQKGRKQEAVAGAPPTDAAQPAGQVQRESRGQNSKMKEKKQIRDAQGALERTPKEREAGLKEQEAEKLGATTIGDNLRLPPKSEADGPAQRQQQQAAKARQAQQAQQAQPAQPPQLQQVQEQSQVQEPKSKVQQPKPQQVYQGKPKQAHQPKPQQVYQPKPQRVYPSPQARQPRPEQTYQPPPQNQNPNATPKGKKKKTVDEPPPPSPSP